MRNIMNTTLRASIFLAANKEAGGQTTIPGPEAPKVETPQDDPLAAFKAAGFEFTDAAPTRSDNTGDKYGWGTFPAPVKVGDKTHYAQKVIPTIDVAASTVKGAYGKFVRAQAKKGKVFKFSSVIVKTDGKVTGLKVTRVA